jgi:phosphoglycolate phosphatase
VETPLCFDAVAFDLDGTLVATDRFWIEAAERGARRAFETLGLRIPLPSAAGWMSLVGSPLEVGFRALFPDLDEPQRCAVLHACVEEEESLLNERGAPAMPGAQELVRTLHGRGVAVGIASNCQRTYLERMLDGLALRPLVRAAYCCESPGVRGKGDMVAHFLAEVGSRAVVLVGDRASDRDAAWQNGIPHVHCAFGFAQGDEDVQSEGRIASLTELIPLLEQRGRRIEEVLERVGVLAGRVRRFGITGPPGVGKTLFARDCRRVLRAHGHAAQVVPVGRGEGPYGPKEEHDGRTLAILEGPGLAADRHGLRLEALIHLEGRGRKRGGGGGGPRPPEPRPDPGDLVLDASNPLLPV